MQALRRLEDDIGSRVPAAIAFRAPPDVAAFFLEMVARAGSLERGYERHARAPARHVNSSERRMGRRTLRRAREHAIEEPTRALELLGRNGPAGLEPVDEVARFEIGLALGGRERRGASPLADQADADLEANLVSSDEFDAFAVAVEYEHEP